MPEDEYKTRLNTVRKLTASIMNLRRGELQKARLELQRERLELLQEKQSLNSASPSKAVSSTSTNARPARAETKRPATPAPASSRPDIRPSAESSGDQAPVPPASTPNPKPAPKIPIPLGRIQSEPPDPSVQTPASQDWSDSVGLGQGPEETEGLNPKAASPSAIPIPKLIEDRSDSVVSALPYPPKLAA